MQEPLNSERATALLAKIRTLKVLVLGDLALDEYLLGRPERLSREGPIPVLRFEERFCLPGAAANPARNLAALGAEVVQIGIVGRDQAGMELKELLAKEDIEVSGLIIDESRPTTNKTRVLAKDAGTPQQVARIDRQSREPVDEAMQDALIRALEHHIEAADLILFSHYRSGVLTQRVCRAARRMASEREILLTADAQGDLERFEEFDLIRIGRGDARRSLGLDLLTEDDFGRAVQQVRFEMKARMVMLGRGPEGMSIGDAVIEHRRIPPTNLREVFDVTGAGDTVIALSSAALAARASFEEAAILSNVAAGIVVGRIGVAAPLPDEIVAAVDDLDLQCLL